MPSTHTKGHWRRRVILGTVVSLCCTLLLLARADAALIAQLEGPVDEQRVSGVAIVRGWVFSDTAGVHITQVNLLVDNNVITSIPCCSARADVAVQYPQYPNDNTTNSGFGITVNYGLLPAGAHTVSVAITDSSGTQRTFTSNVTVVKAGDFAFLDLVDLSGATAQRDGQDVVLTGVRVRDKASQQTAQITARLRWFSNVQGLGLV